VSLLELFQLIGFATGAALHLYLAWLFLRQRGTRNSERTLLWLGFVIGVWFFGNFIETIFALLDVRSAIVLRRSADTLAYAALSCLPPLTLHAQMRLWQFLDHEAKPKYIRFRVVLCYLPLLVLPYSLSFIWRGAYAPPVEKLAPFLTIFILWIAAVLWESGGINLYLARKITTTREKHFFEALAVTLFVMGALFVVTYIVGARKWGVAGQYLEALAKMSSLVPTALIAYYIYRYRYLELVIRQSFVYAAFALTVMVIYLYGIRRIAGFIEANYDIRAGVVEAILILGLMFLAEPMRRVTERNIQRLFNREVGLYRDLVTQVGSDAAHYHSLLQFIEFAERHIAEALALNEIRLITAANDATYQKIFCYAEQWELTQIEEAEILHSLEALACYALWREEKVVGLMLVRSLPPELTAEKREVLSVLSGHLAIAIERAMLLEEKVKLERELAEQARLAVMGQMAATIAHEIKNPLSSIKSIAQVMREDEAVSREYARDLDLITNEINRLNRSVSQLLSFSRPAVVAASSSSLSELVSNVLSLTRAECRERGIAVTTDLQIDPTLDGTTVAALKEILVNLVLNAAQAMPANDEPKQIHLAITAPLTITITDNGVGIPPALQSKIFEPFFTTKQRGTGLGLAIVARRVRELGAKLSVISPVSDGRGTRFELKLTRIEKEIL
jgi:signal transduction histidine kinase